MTSLYFTGSISRHDIYFFFFLGRIGKFINQITFIFLSLTKFSDYKPQSGPCKQDLGGPGRLGPGLLSGIVSLGMGCDHRRLPSLFTNVARVEKWIKEIIKGYCYL